MSRVRAKQCAWRLRVVSALFAHERAHPSELRLAGDAVVLVEAEGPRSGRPALHVAELDAGVIVRRRRDDRVAIGVLCAAVCRSGRRCRTTRHKKGSARQHVQMLVGVGSDAPGA